jgi:poly(A) polymerase
MTGRGDPARIEPYGWMVEPATRAVLHALAAGGVEARFVGGVVRDALLGVRMEEVSPDIDIAVSVPPQRVIELLEESGIKVVPTGLAHGTVTAIASSAPGALPRKFEITTLRRDVETDGRRARVAFDADWAADAARRDFTINAIYLSPDGTINDPIGGLADLRVRRVRFVGDPAKRIAEDVLRILRYYRFEAQFGVDHGDPAARAACRAAAHCLPKLSTERVSQELMRVLRADQPCAAVAMMAEDGVLATILPEARHLDRLRRIVALDPDHDPLRRLAALVQVDTRGAVALAARMRFPNSWRDRLTSVMSNEPGQFCAEVDPDADEQAQRRSLYDLGVERYCDIVLLQAAADVIAPDRVKQLLVLARNWVRPRFPLTGDDVMALGIAPGPRIGAVLAVVEEWWRDADFAPDRGQCMARLAAIAGELHDASSV